jgi:acyl-CoA reductase-like NAD-dependent aldehyde dehydrogenase
MVGAIAAGNCVVVKPGSYSAHSSHLIVQIVNR